ncbi:hypothetical protein [Pseudonocardia alaniniphila]|uniref:ARB-07466-like C-terminal domain-containing protein n=1 Tax=Pseudonocardia alaniniphila TaxID=75291 RepID=A0ABS9TB43_9PSEU|nr:hypothetical protein [Pseudonocardia alaniniphila]MCH6165764.1 hypothetical protein [Pseudonocardia alaniniphila]
MTALGRQAPAHAAQGSVSTPLRRGTAVVAVTGGAFSLVGAASMIPVVVDTAAAPVALSIPVETGEDVVLRSSMEPVPPDPDVVDAKELVKAVQLIEQQLATRAAEQAAAEERAAREKQAAAEKIAATVASGSPDCDMDTSGLGAVKSFVRSAAETLGCRFGEPTMYGVAGRAGTSDHPGGKAVDFMVDRATGDALASCALKNKDALGISYVIWEQQINFGSGWQPMEDRGGVTANHFDHVHISFGSGGGGRLRGC